MGRTATAFLVLMAVGGCVADDQGPMAAFPGGKPGADAGPSYASWSRPRPEQFAALQDDTTPAASPRGAPAAKATTTTVQKPSSGQKQAPPAATATLAAKPSSPAPTTCPAEGVVDAQLVNATMVTTPADKPATDSAKCPADAAKAPPDPRPALDVEQAANDPGAPSIRMVNSKRVTLNYELKDVGASGVSGVELWCTQDAHSWKKGEIVAQTSHSFTVEVKEEGLYGFTLLARNGSGVGKDAPASGEQPQTWVMVDVTKPTVQIASVEISKTAKTPTVEIHWSAKDKNLGPRPITLSYAEAPEGPWTPIAAGVENSGMYEWQPPAKAPQRVYLKVEAVDMPGNAASAQTANPLRLDALAAVVAPPPPDTTHKTLPAPPALDTSRPTAAILAVEPGGN